MITPLKIPISKDPGQVSAVLNRPEGAVHLLVLAHGSKIPMEHPFMESLASHLAGQKIATLRFRFLYMEQGRSEPDPIPLAQLAIQKAIEYAIEIADGIPVFAGGKSYGGRMISWLASTPDLPPIKGILFYGFPLHFAENPGTERADHLKKVSSPMLFLQGTHDPVAQLPLIREVCEALPLATLNIIEGGNHSFESKDSSGTSHEAMLMRLAKESREWMDALVVV